MNISTWFTEDMWIKGSSAQDSSGLVVHRNSLEAAKFDLTSAIKVSYPESEQEEALNKVRSYIKSVYPERAKSCRRYYEVVGGPRDGTKDFTTTIYLFNDHPDTTWEDIEKLFSLVDI
jgi:hypothetical protein